MKNLIFFFGTLFCSGPILQAQDISKSQVPSVLLNEFTRLFPQATDVEWELKDEFYQVEFEDPKDFDQVISFYEDGQIRIQHSEIAISALPKKIIDKIKKEYPEYELEEAEKLIDQVRGTHYKIELNSLLKQDYEIWMDENGNVEQKIVD